MESVLWQDGFVDYEWFIMNDGSTDDTWNVVNKFVEKKSSKLKGPVHLIDGKENCRIPRRRNLCIDQAKGKYVCIHDGDDVSLPHRFRIEYGYLERHPNVFCVGGHATSINLDSEPIGKMNYPAITHDRIVRQLYGKTNPMIDPTTMFRRQDFLDLGRYTLRKDIYTVPDMHLWCRAILSGRKMANLPMPLINYRVNPDSMTGLHKEEMIRAHMIVWREFANKLKENPIVLLSGDSNES